MVLFIVKRIISSIPILLGVTLLIFILLHIVPGDPVTLMMNDHVDPDTIARVRAQMHLDEPIYVQYFNFVWDALHGDFGVSYKMNRPVATLLLDAFPNTLVLATAAMIFSWVVGVPAGILSVVKKYSVIDYFFMGSALLGVSMPVFWSGLLLQYIFAFTLGWLPVSGFDNPLCLIMPAVVLGWGAAGTIARLTRSSLLEVMGNDYIRTARAKGLSALAVLFNHALKNSFLPVVTVMAIQVASMLSGSVITETIFSIPGIGRIAVNAIQTRDLPLLQGSILFTTLLVILGNLAADMMYFFLDPRIKNK
ncbi:ABC transporter permease [Sporomusa sp. KB1]|uniref:ABC transporter permease n=2 Tax=Sporomusa sp. KB1 TaxID=943346 RepID=UPI0011A17B89|nr:ABC transporter permease [Sporomusa sp. KB1]TWH45015.1 peptide/nickel transport system permease protein [Sporomusa sp. KB1]